MVKMVDCDTAFHNLRSGMNVYVQGIAMTPTPLLKALSAKALGLTEVSLYHIHLEGPVPHLDPLLSGHLHDISWFIGQNTREYVDSGQASYLPLFLSDIPSFVQNNLPLDYALIHVTPPDRHGFVSLGTSVESALAAIRKARVVVAAVNPMVPRTLGSAEIPASAITYGIWNARSLYTRDAAPQDPVRRKIAAQVAALIPDRATLQLGIGAIPDLVLSMLADHHDLGIHSEMISDSVVPLVRQGVITGRYKAMDRDRLVCTFAFGSQSLYDFMDNNPAVAMRPVDYTNDTAVIRRHPRMISINSAVEVDLTGQVAAESVGRRMLSGVGGQMDFVRGSSLSPGGFSVIALPSRTSAGQPRIVPTLHPGAAVTTTRNHVQFVVTEYGVANLHGLSLAQRAQQLIGLAHPDDRDALREAGRRQLTIH